MRTQLTFSVATEGRRFSGVAYSGGKIPAYGAFGNVAIDLATASITPKAFALLDHDPRARVGVAEFARIGNEIHVSGHLLDNAHGNEVASVAAQGGPWQLSVGITAAAVKQKSPISINGQSLDVDHVFTNAIIREVSFVTAGADPNTSVKIFAEQNKALELELAQLRSEQILTRYPNATAEQVAVIGALSRQVFDVVMALAKQPAKPQNQSLSAVVSTAGTPAQSAPEGVNPERHALFLRASAIMAAEKVSFVEALKLAQEGVN